MAECLKAFFSVVGAHTGGAYAAKAQGGNGKMNDGIVDTAAAEGNMFDHVSLEGPIVGKKIEGKSLEMRCTKETAS